MRKFLIPFAALVLLTAMLFGCAAGSGARTDTVSGDKTSPAPGTSAENTGGSSGGKGGEEPVTTTAPATDTRQSETDEPQTVTTGAPTATTATAEKTTAATTGQHLPTGPETDPDEGKPFTVAVTGDLSFADNWEILQNAAAKGYETEDFIGTSLLERMRSADLLMVNNEFCFSDRGEPLPGKYYTFRGATANVRYLHDLGADIACLANNHVYDFGDVAFADTMATLKSAGIPYIGAGMNEAEAYSPYYTEINGVKLAFLAASMAEKSFYKQRVASGDTLGIAGIFDAARFIQAIKEADSNADVVIVYAHWGTEYSETLLSSQTRLAHEFIDSGADIVLGAHAHILQGMEFYNGKPILYNLGNFWFNMKDLETMLVRIEFANGGYEIFLDPARQKKGITTEITGAANRRAFFDHLQEISVNAAISDDGRLYEITAE